MTTSHKIKSGTLTRPGEVLAEVKRVRLARRGREKQLSTLKQGPVLSTIDKTGDTHHNTQKEIAADLGWSTGKVAERLRRKGREKYEQTRVFYGNQHTGLLSTIDNEPQDKVRDPHQAGGGIGGLGWKKLPPQKHQSGTLTRPGEVLAEVKAERLRKKGRDIMSEARKQAWNKEALSTIDKPIDIPHNTQKEIAADLVDM